MKRSLITIFMVALIPLLAMSQRVGERTKVPAPELSIEYVMDTDNFYVGQPVPVVVTLRSSTPDVVSADKSEPLLLRKGSFDTFQLIDPAGASYRKLEGGKTWFYFPIEAYMITMAESGRYEFAEGEYEIGVSYPVVRHDPFWGNVRSNKVENFNVKTGKKSFKVKSLPNPPSEMDFSGSVGEFTIETVVPSGDIYLGEEATAYIVLRGSGMIAERVLPEYRDAFKNGVRLKSISEWRDEGHDHHGGMMSELRLECTFIPTDRDNAVIGEATFDYFDPYAGKYRTARSKPVKIDVKSTVSKREHIDI